MRTVFKKKLLMAARKVFMRIKFISKNSAEHRIFNLREAMQTPIKIT